MLKERIITAAVLLAGLIVCFLGGSIPLTVLAFLVHLCINFEYLSFATKLPPRYFNLQMLLVSLLPLALLTWGLDGFSLALFAVLILSFCAQIVLVESETHERELQVEFPPIFLGLAYTGLLGSSLVYSAYYHSKFHILWIMLIVILCDTFAFFGGRLIGGKKLAPRISPNKTISGALVGLLFGTAFAALTPEYFDIPFSATACGVLGIAVGIFSIFGDLAESLVKRAFRVKESGTLLPGHGGVLDRVDAMLFSLPLLHLFSSL